MSPGGPAIVPFDSGSSLVASLLQSQVDVFSRRFGPKVGALLASTRGAPLAEGLVGYVLTEGGIPKGYALARTDGRRRFLSSLWATSGEVDRGEGEGARSLLERILFREETGAAGDEDLVEANDLGFGEEEGAWEPLLMPVAARSWRRLYLEIEPRARAPLRNRERHCAIDCRPFREADLFSCAEVGWRAFRSTPERDHASSYRDLSGCLERILLACRGTEWGPLVPEASLSVIRDGRLAGYALVTEMGAGNGHLVEMAVCPSVAGVGIGRTLLDRTLTKSERAGLRRVFLSVSESNERALRLYRAAGFRNVRAFHAYRLRPGTNRSPSVEICRSSGRRV
jgi:ribosomal protein S18 acetylase RimI-like enzyme